MAAFFTDLLDSFAEPVFLEKVRIKFHFGEAQAADLRAVAEEMLPLMRQEAFWERRESRVPEQQGGKKGIYGKEGVYEEVVMSLGSGVDALQESYGRREMLSESYMLETLANELLMQGYAAYNRYLAEHADWHVAVYHFPGSGEGFPLEMLPGLLEGYGPRITCNAAFCISPKKSVAFVAELTQDEKIRCAGICAGCSQIRCPNRMAGDLEIRIERINKKCCYFWKR